MKVLGAEAEEGAKNELNLATLVSGAWQFTLAHSGFLLIDTRIGLLKFFRSQCNEHPERSLGCLGGSSQSETRDLKTRERS